MSVRLEGREIEYVRVCTCARERDEEKEESKQADRVKELDSQKMRERERKDDRDIEPWKARKQYRTRMKILFITNKDGYMSRESNIKREKEREKGRRKRSRMYVCVRVYARERDN